MIQASIIANPNQNAKYVSYRLPGLIVTQKGTLISYWEARTTTDDMDQMDLHISRSTDGGTTWSEPNCLADGETYCAQYNGVQGEQTINNPVMIVGNDEKLHLLFSFDNGYSGLFYSVSDDDGVTWSTPINIKSMLEIPSGYVRLSCGPTHGICMENGKLVVPIWLAPSDFTEYATYTLYSDDNGETWALGARVADNLNETAIALLADGRVMLNSRQFHVPYTSNNPNGNKPEGEQDARRRVSISSTGIDAWSDTVIDTALPDPACEGSMTSVALENDEHAVLFVNNNSTTDRKNLTIYCSFDDGTSWSKSILLDAECGAYSDVAVGKDGTVYVVHESTVSGGYALELFRFSFEEAFGKKVASEIDWSDFSFGTGYYQKGTVDGFSIRLVSEFKGDYTKLSKLGYEVTVNYKGQTESTTLEFNTLYTSLLADGQRVYPITKDACFAAHGISGLPTDAEILFSIRPYAVTLDNQTVYGAENSFKVRYMMNVIASEDCLYTPWGVIWD